MVRTQIYLTQVQQDSLRDMARRSGRKQSELIREAIDLFVRTAADDDYRSRIRQGHGLWRDRDDLPDFDAIRREGDRHPRG